MSAPMRKEIPSGSSEMSLSADSLDSLSLTTRRTRSSKPLPEASLAAKTASSHEEWRGEDAASAADPGDGVVGPLSAVEPGCGVAGRAACAAEDVDGLAVAEVDGGGAAAAERD